MPRKTTAVPDESSPLTEEHYALLRRLESSCAATGEYLTKCEACFVDVATEKDANDDQRRVCAAIRSEFFANRV